MLILKSCVKVFFYHQDEVSKKRTSVLIAVKVFPLRLATLAKQKEANSHQ